MKTNKKDDLSLLDPTLKDTYFIPKNLLPGSCFFEFQPGKYKVGKYWFSKSGETRLDNSLYLYGDDDGIFDFSAIAPFAYLIDGSHPDPKAGEFFDYTGITYIDENNGKNLISNLRKFAELLAQGKQVYAALGALGCYDENADGSWAEEDSIKKLDLKILANTAEKMANWLAATLAEHKWVSVLGI